MRRATTMRSGRAAALGLDDTEAPFKRFLKRNLIGASGLGLIALCAALAAALATWSATDPSFSHATSAPVRNALGLPGAVVADILMQAIGLSVAVFLVPVVLWGWRLLSAKATRIALRRLVAWIAGTLLGAGALAALPVPSSWPLPTGLGGFLGDFVYKLPEMVTGELTEGMAMIVGGLGLGVPAVILLLRAAGWLGADPEPVFEPLPEPSRHARSVGAVPDYGDDEDEDERDSRWAAAAGALAHWGLLARATLRRRLRRPARAAEPVYEDDDYPDTSDPAEDYDPRMEREFAEDDYPGGAEEDHDAPEEEHRSGGRVRFGTLRRRLAERLMPKEDDGLDDYYPDDERDEPGERRGPRVVTSGGTIDDLPDLDDEGPLADFGTSLPRSIAGPASRAETPNRVVPPAARPKPGKRVAVEAQPSFLRPAESYELPPLRLLAEPKGGGRQTAINTDALEQNARILEGVLEDFGVRGEIIEVRPGPVVTLYELEPAPGIKSSRVIGLADDIARSMSAISARVAVIPGKNAIGIELPNQRRETVYLRELLAASDYEKSKAKLALTLGKTIGGEPVIADLARMPHLLVAGTTGSGKSVAINTMIMSLLYRLEPEQCKLIMIDPKMLELSIYDGIPHLLTPVVTDPKKAVVALKWTVREMEERYKKMSKMGVRNIDGYNTRVTQALEKGEVFTRTVQTGFDRETGEPIFEDEELPLEKMPYIVVIVDEMADLMMVAGKDIEGAIQRLAQMARAAGIHIIMATQRPSVDVITGTIKANFPTRISFQVTSKIDSRTILGEQGAEQLLGQGDMLYMAGGGRIQRVHGPFVSDDEVEQIVTHLKRQGTPQYLEAVTEEDEVSDSPYDQSGGGGGDDGNDLYDKAVAIVLRDKKASTSYVQRRLSIGYNRAASIIERMEQEGLVSAANHAGKREILVKNGVEDDF
ncbi:FtsK/SpoIIIE family DNA translocase [Stappia indica]|uniref:FtsK/SpoIIIE family DNA translocase n=1 Tax=Stappia indica TaxID=538381 RepID=UPI001CD203AF|nr:DNA translocase FtsK [Stappia indica]MCA1299710.1 DNA translocase FtsK [Stappia indica]